MLAEMITHRNGGCRSPVASVLISEVGNIVQIELRAYEKAFCNWYLDAGSEVKLEMIRAAER